MPGTPSKCAVVLLSLFYEGGTKERMRNRMLMTKHNVKSSSIHDSKMDRDLLQNQESVLELSLTVQNKGYSSARKGQSQTLG